MLYSMLFVFTSLLATAVGVSLDLQLIVTQSPVCAQVCTLQVLNQIPCRLDEMRTCVCPSPDVQKAIATCVTSKCNMTEQYATTNIFQQHVCYGIPQERRSNDLIRCCIVLAIITYPIVLLRFISRWKIAQKIWWDDWCILTATLFLIPQTAIPLYHMNEGFGRHFWDLPTWSITPLRKTFYIVQIFYCLVLAFAKMSILFLYLRIFTDKKFRTVTQIMFAVVITHGIVFLFCIMFQCVPVSAIWTLQPARCLNLQAMVFSGAGLSIFEDFFIMLMPIWELHKLNLSARKKIALIFMFALGSFASITSIVRLRYLASYSNSTDVTWDNTDVVIWSNIEMFSAVICASVICIRPLIKQLLPSFLCNTEVSEITPSPFSNEGSKQLKDSSTTQKFTAAPGQDENIRLRNLDHMSSAHGSGNSSSSGDRSNMEKGKGGWGSVVDHTIADAKMKSKGFQRVFER